MKQGCWKDALLIIFLLGGGGKMGKNTSFFSFTKTNFKICKKFYFSNLGLREDCYTTTQTYEKQKGIFL